MVDLVFTKDPQTTVTIDYSSPISKSDHAILKILSSIGNMIKVKKEERYWGNEQIELGRPSFHERSTNNNNDRLQ